MKQKKMKQKRMRKIGIASALGLVVLVVLGLYGASNYMLNYSLNYPKEERMTAEHWKNRMKNECPWMIGWMDSVYQHHCVKDTFVVMPSGYKAHAIYLYAPKPTEKTAVVVHGYQVRSEGMLHIAYLYNHDMGYNVLLPDLYGHGESEGDHIQMGWKDRWDVIRWSEIANEIFKVKNTLQNLENVGWCKPGHEGYYNIYIMEDVTEVDAVGLQGPCHLSLCTEAYGKDCRWYKFPF